MRHANNQYADKSHSQNAVVLNIFEVGSAIKQGLGAGNLQRESEQLFRSLHNHYMLFHGTSKANLLSIMEQGLQLAPRNAAMQHGSAFGQGIYLSDSFEVAAKYSEGSSEESYYVLVCETALGNVMNSLYGGEKTD